MDVLPSGNDQHSIEDDVPDHERQRNPERQRYAYCRPSGQHKSIIAAPQTHDHHERHVETKALFTTIDAEAAEIAES